MHTTCISHQSFVIRRRSVLGGEKHARSESRHVRIQSEQLFIRETVICQIFSLSRVSWEIIALWLHSERPTRRGGRLHSLRQIRLETFATWRSCGPTRPCCLFPIHFPTEFSLASLSCDRRHGRTETELWSAKIEESNEFVTRHLYRIATNLREGLYEERRKVRNTEKPGGKSLNIFQTHLCAHSLCQLNK